MATSAEPFLHLATDHRKAVEHVACVACAPNPPQVVDQFAFRLLAQSLLRFFVNLLPSALYAPPDHIGDSHNLDCSKIGFRYLLGSPQFLNQVLSQKTFPPGLGSPPTTAK